MIPDFANVTNFERHIRPYGIKLRVMFTVVTQCTRHLVKKFPRFGGVAGVWVVLDEVAKVGDGGFAILGDGEQAVVVAGPFEQNACEQEAGIGGAVRVGPSLDDDP